MDQDVYRLLLFPFAVKDQAKRWLNNQPTASIKTWKQLSDKFLNHFYPPKRMTQLRLDIQGFKQGDNESLYDAWERYREMLRKCPSEMFSEWVQLDIFYYGLTEKAQMSLDHSAGGSIHMRKTIEDAQELIDTVARNQHLYSNSESSIKEEAMAVTTDSNPQEQIVELNQQLLLMTKQLAEFKEMLQDTKNANKNIEAQLNQTRQQLSKQITEECQAVQLRSGKTLNNSAQSSKKSRKEQMTEDDQTTAQNPSEDSKSPERNYSDVQTPEKGEKLALNTQSMSS